MKADGTSYANASPTAAPHHPIRSLGTRNLTINTTESAIWVHRSAAGGEFCSITCAENSLTFYPAVYFRHTGGALFNGDNYTQVSIISTTLTYTGEGRTNRSDCALGVCTYAQEIQNFANWYTYYRSRMLASQASIGRAFSTQPPSMRVGFGAINKGSTTVDGSAASTIILGVRPFSGTDRDDFYTKLYEGVWSPSNTPLRKALDDAGQYFSRTGDKGPWGAVPGTDDTTAHLTCRQSFTILMTDGYWTDNDASRASTSAARANVDGTAASTITEAGPPPLSFTYTPSTPFTDTHSNTLADVAMYYWNRDLRPTLANRVPKSDFNPAFWQHMVTYGVGLGVTGSVTPGTAFGAIGASPPVSVTWPNPTSSNAAKLDDLLHAAVNSRGGFFSAADPETFAAELSGVLKNIVARVAASGTAAATSSAVLQSDTLLYTASFRSTDWSGTLVAREVSGTDGVAGALKWDAEQVMSSTLPSARKLFTSKVDGTKVTLDYALLSLTQQAALTVNPTGAAATTALGADRIAWLRGTEHAGLRNRVVDGVARRIGDLVNSDPQFMFKRDFGNSLLGSTEGSSYVTFRNTSTYKARPDVLFVGSNGGMLHAFHAGTPYVDDPLTTPVKEEIIDPDGGKELFAYVPSELLLPGTTGTHAQINQLMRPDYARRPYVDGSPAVADAYWDSSWKSVLVGSMGAGGRTVFALDVTDPETFDATKVLWEFRHDSSVCVADPAVGSPTGSSACREIGYGVSKPKIARMRDGSWVAIFGNGYNSFSQKAKLFVVDLKTGRLKYLLDAGTDGTAAVPNGLAAVETTDWPASDLKLSRAYAGDLRGKMWRFDFQTTPPTVASLFTATNAAGVVQPITARPSVALNPNDPSKIVVLFGTGSFFRVGDDSIVSPQVQTMYGVFDAVTPVVGTARSQLLGQTISSNTAEVTIGAVTYPIGSLRFITTNALDTSKKGWLIDLPGLGERVISEPIFPSGAVQTRVRFSTLIPSNDPCGSGRTGFVMDFNLLSGARAPKTVFDFNGDGVFNASDDVGGVPVSGIGGTTGERITVIRKADRAVDFLYGGDGGKLGDSAGAGGPVGRQSWRQLR
ncbi:pilus assembly protein [Hydrogenophaga sp.]|uniref:pilus assembly protein n=1 Tax=Hydrogenophaga sp. TaxID=1904254 RepID=UPI002730913B|nr:PilC/PilY family type IV pilus protein [Hydrogenophaga sp.]MDP2016203.1 PilC/PilY family type IV pilus protein [Hydrogenophaga sp.]